jgi:hypothetical protein
VVIRSASYHCAAGRATAPTTKGNSTFLPHLDPAWPAQLAHAVGRVGLLGALRRISGATDRDRRLGGIGES